MFAIAIFTIAIFTKFSALMPELEKVPAYFVRCTYTKIQI